MPNAAVAAQLGVVAPVAGAQVVFLVQRAGAHVGEMFEIRAWFAYSILTCHGSPSKRTASLKHVHLECYEMEIKPSYSISLSLYTSKAYQPINVAQTAKVSTSVTR